MNHSPLVESAITEALAYGDQTKLSATKRWLDFKRQFFTFIAPPLLIVGAFLVWPLVGAVTGLSPQAGGHLCAAMMVAAVFCSLLGQSMDGGGRYSDIGNYEKTCTNLTVVRQSPGAVAVEQAVLKHANKLHWVHVFIMEGVYRAEKKAGLFEETWISHY